MENLVILLLWVAGITLGLVVCDVIARAIRG
jgi:hypothetical protein